MDGEAFDRIMHEIGRHRALLRRLSIKQQHSARLIAQSLEAIAESKFLLGDEQSSFDGKDGS